jgi:predicted component of type VI protein secretion system
MSSKSLLHNNRLFTAFICLVVLGVAIWSVTAQRELSKIGVQLDATKSMVANNLTAVAALQSRIVELNNDIRDIKVDVTVIKKDIAELKANGLHKH